MSYNDIEDTVAAITEFVSVGMHAMDRFLHLGHSKRERIAVIGDGSLALLLQILSIIPCQKQRLSSLVAIGKN